MDSFDEAVQFAQKQADAGWKGVAAEFIITAPAGRRLDSMIEASAERPVVWDAVWQLALRLLRDGEPLPGELASWVADVLEEKRQRPNRGRPGRPRMWARDSAVVAAVKALEARGFQPTRNKSGLEKACAEGGSACDAVGVAFGIEKYKTVERVWSKFRKREKRKIPEAMLRWIGIRS